MCLRQRCGYSESDIEIFWNQWRGTCAITIINIPSTTVLGDSYARNTLQNSFTAFLMMSHSCQTRGNHFNWKSRLPYFIATTERNAKCDKTQTCCYWRAGASQPSRTTGTIFRYINMRKMRMRNSLRAPHSALVSGHNRFLYKWPSGFWLHHRYSYSIYGYIHGFGVPHTERTAYTGRWGYPISRGLRPKSSNGSLSCL